jgi:DNA-binding response OmpR family regulator
MPRRILVVDDHVPTRTVIRRVIEAERTEQFEVHEAGTGTECLRIANEHGPFALVLLDVILPDLDGYSVCRTLRRMDKNVPIVFVTVAGDLSSCAKGCEAGCDSYLVKPITRTALTSVVRLFTSIARASAPVSPPGGEAPTGGTT